MTIRLILFLVFLNVLTGCLSPTASDSLYRESEVGVAKNLKACTVLAVREVAIKAEDGDNYGAVAGAVVGGTAGSGIGGGTGRVLAAELGAIAGAIVGSSLGDSRKLPGLEYTVSDQQGNAVTLVQNYLDGERIVQSGEKCWLQESPAGRNRVLPAGG